MNSHNKWIDRLHDSPEGRLLLERERLWFETTEALCELMEREGVSRAELARRLRTSSANVTHLLSGTRNLTLKTLADAFFALDRSAHVTHGPLEVLSRRSTGWIEEQKRKN